MPTSPPDEARSRYLDALLASSGTLHFPISSGQHHLPLQAIFQPLTLRHGPFSFEDTNRNPSQRETEVTSAITAHDGTEALARSPLHRMVVLGGPGTGKTTLLKVLLQRAIHDAQTNDLAPLPLFISLPDLARSGLTLGAYLPNILAQLDNDTNDANLLMEAVNEGRAFLCLDSLDEVVPAQRPDMIALINREALRCGGTWIIGSRFTEYKGGQFTHGQFSEWELQPLDREMRLELARHLLPVLANLLQTTPTPSARDFVEALDHDERIAIWGKNPLLFSLTAMVYVQAGMLPGCRATLYRDILALLLTARTADQQERDELRLLLADIAFQLYQTRGRNFTVADLLELLTTRSPNLPFQAYTATVARILDSGLLDVVAYQAYGFQHQMFQEYLAAVALARQFSSQDEAERNAAWEFAWRKHTYSRWGEVLRLCVGVLVQEYGKQGSQIAAQWLHRLADERNTVDGDVGNLCLELALGSLREFGTIPPSTELADIARTLILTWAELLVTQQIRRSSNDRLWRLVEDVKVLDLSLVLPAIVWLDEVRGHRYKELDASDVSYHTEAILQALNANIPALDALIYEHSTPFHAQASVIIPAHVLASIFPDAQGISLAASTQPATLRKYASMPQLLRLLLDTQAHWRIRGSAASLLGAWEDQTPITILSEILEDTTCYYRIRIAAAYALGQQRERMPIERLVALLQHDDDERIRATIATVLANAGERLPLEPLLAALEDADRVNEASWSTLQKLQKQLAYEPLLSALHSENADLRAAALYLLKDRTLTELLLEALHDTHARVREAAASISGTPEDRVPIDLLVEALHDQDGDVRKAALITLGTFKKRAPTQSLLEALQDQDREVRREARRILRSGGGDISTESLVTLAQKPEMMSDALELAEHLHISLPVELLLAGLNDKLYGAADHAILLLASLGEHAPITALLDILRDPSSIARLGAARALALLPPHVPVEPILAIVQEEFDASIPLYNYLLILLLRSGVPVSPELLVGAIRTRYRWSRDSEKDTLVIALGDLGEQAPIEALLRILPNDAKRYGWEPDHRALQVLKSITAEWITPQHLLTTAQHDIEDELLALGVLEEMGKNAPTDFIKSILDDETRDPRLRARARRTLHEAGIYLPLSYFLAEEDLGYEGTDGYTIEAMRNLGPQAPIDELLNLLVSNERWKEHPSIWLDRAGGNNDDWVHDTVMDALRELVPYLPLEILIATLDHNNPLARKGAARVLGACGERAPIDKLIALLHNPKEPCVVRAAALRSLAELQPYTSPEAVTTVLRDKDSDIRRLALESLEKWGRDIPLEPLLALLDDDEYDLRSDAIEALGWLQDRAPVDLLLTLLDGEDEQDAASAAKALGRMGKYAPLDVLVAHIYNKDGDMSPEILEVLGGMGKYAPLEILLQALDNENDEIRRTITYALDGLAEATPAKFMALAKHDQRAPVRDSLMKAIAKLGKDAPIELAVAALGDDSHAHFAACEALLNLDIDPEIIPIEPLLRAVYERRGYWVELYLLAKCGARAPVEPLLALLGDSEMTVCESAARALYQTHPDVFVEVAQQAEAILRGEPTGSLFASRVQSRIADRVEQIGHASSETLAMITDLLDWPYWEVRLKAAQTLGTIHRNIPDRAIRRLMELRHDSSSQLVCEAADQALAEILSRESGMEDEES